MSCARPLLLIAEDNVLDEKLIQRAISKAGLACQVEVVSDGEQAVAYLAGDPPYHDRQRYPLPALLLLDLKMPLKDGFEVLIWLRRQPFLRRLPTVIFTTSNHAPDIARAYDLGVSSYLVKPLALQDLIELVKTIDHYWLRRNIWPEIHPAS